MSTTSRRRPKNGTARIAARLLGQGGRADMPAPGVSCAPAREATRPRQAVRLIHQPSRLLTAALGRVQAMNPRSRNGLWLAMVCQAGHVVGGRRT